MDSELTNYKGGIDVIWGVGDGSDKGTAYQEEYWYYDKLINDTKTVYLKDDTLISMYHNDRNMGNQAAGSSDRQQVLIGARGNDGLTDIIFSNVTGSSSNNTLYANSHGLNTGSRVMYLKGSGFSSLRTWTNYFVINSNTDDFQLATIQGGTAVAIGSNGSGGYIYSGDDGIIRYEIDKLWSKTLSWANKDQERKPPYLNPFTLATREYEPGVPVIGTTGGKPGFAQDNTGFYWRGLIDSVGDEWHVLMVADDDQNRGGGDDASANDGKYMLLCTNPKTPCLTFRGISGGQFYTTPAWKYWTPKIYDQITYLSELTGQVSLQIVDIYQNPVIYRINSGSWITGTSNVTLYHTNFNSGHNTLDYYYSGNQAYTKTRVIHRNPVFPSLNENHGDILWGTSGWNNFLNRIIRLPYSRVLHGNTSMSNNNQTSWNLYGRTGLRFGGSNWPWKNDDADKNAFLAKYLGFTAKATGASLPYAEYAKNMLLETSINQHPVGMEVTFWASNSLACPDIYYRGYWDVDMIYSSAIAYDILIGNYRNDQNVSGLTPIHDYFLRDKLADHVHQCLINIGGFCETGPGMWNISKYIGATMISIIMPSYSTYYYGTCGMDGNTGVYLWSPYQIYNYTWKDIFIDHNYQTGLYPNGPEYIFGLEGTVADRALIRLTGSIVSESGVDYEATWIDRKSYCSYSQMGHNICTYAMLQAIHAPYNNHPAIIKFLEQDTRGELWGAKDDDTGTGINFGPHQQHCIITLNKHYPTVAISGIPIIKSLPTNDSNYESSAVTAGGFLSAIWYDDTYSGIIGESGTIILQHKHFINQINNLYPLLLWRWN